MTGLRLDTRLGPPAQADYEAITPTQARPNDYSLFDAYMPSATPRATYNQFQQQPINPAPPRPSYAQPPQRSQLASMSYSNNLAGGLSYAQFYEAAAVAAASGGYLPLQEDRLIQQDLGAFGAMLSSAREEQTDLGFSSASETASTGPATPLSCRASPASENLPLGNPLLGNEPDMSLYPQQSYSYDDAVQAASVYGNKYNFYPQNVYATQPYASQQSINGFSVVDCSAGHPNGLQSAIQDNTASMYSGYEPIAMPMIPDISSGYRSCSSESASSTASSTAASPAPSFADFDEALLRNSHFTNMVGNEGYTTEEEEKPTKLSRRSTSSSVSSGGSDSKARKSFVCSFPGCGKAFSRNFNLSTHYNTHLGIKPFACPHCPKSFSRRHDCARHVAAVHVAAENNSKRTCGCDCNCATGAHSRDVEPARAFAMCDAMNFVKLEEE